MTALRLLAAFLVPVAMGHLVMTAIDRRRNLAWFEKLVLGYFPGIGILMTAMFVMGLLSVRLVLVNVCAWLGVIAALLAAVIWKFPPDRPRQTRPTSLKTGVDWVLLAAFLAVLAYKVGLAAVFTLQSPTYQDDSLQRWNMRAKVFYYRGELVLDRQDPEFLGQPGWSGNAGAKLRTRAYPPHTSLFKTWVALATGRYDDEAVNLVNPVTYGFFCLSIPILLSLIVGMRRGLIGGYLILSIPYLWIHASNPYAEIFVLSFCTLACVGLFLTISRRGWQAYGWYFALCLAFLPGTKKEGLILSLIILAVYALWLGLRFWKEGRSWPAGEYLSLLAPIAPLGLMVILWLAYQHYIDGSILFRGHAGDGPSEIFLRPEALSAFKTSLWERGNFGLFPALLAVVTLWRAPKILKSDIMFAYLPFVIMLAAVIFQLSFTASYVEAARGTGINRALIEILPTGILAAYIAAVYDPLAGRCRQDSQ